MFRVVSACTAVLIVGLCAGNARISASGGDQQRPAKGAPAPAPAAVAPGALYALGLRYATGDGVVRDDAQALRWFQVAAAEGHADAMLRIAEHHAKGRGVAVDLVEACKWLELANALGSSDARERSAQAREELLRVPQVTPEVVAKAQTLALAWRTEFEARKK